MKESEKMALGYDNFLEDQYRVPLMAKILHSLPHLNITFHRTNNTFRPTDEIYLEVSCGFDARKIDNSGGKLLTRLLFLRVWAFSARYQPRRSSSRCSACCST
jgi:Tweety